MEEDENKKDCGQTENKDNAAGAMSNRFTHLTVHGKYDEEDSEVLEDVQPV